jgi:hypothetical protein
LKFPDLHGVRGAGVFDRWEDQTKRRPVRGVGKINGWTDRVATADSRQTRGQIQSDGCPVFSRTRASARATRTGVRRPRGERSPASRFNSPRAARAKETKQTMRKNLRYGEDVVNCWRNLVCSFATAAFLNRHAFFISGR